jgi:hypothetical protein
MFKLVCVALLLGLLSVAGAAIGAVIFIATEWMLGGSQ